MIRILRHIPSRFLVSFVEAVMTNTGITAILNLKLILAIACIAGTAHSQQPANAIADSKRPVSPEMIEELIGQNRELQQQNRQLEQQNRHLEQQNHKLLEQIEQAVGSRQEPVQTSDVLVKTDNPITKMAEELAPNISPPAELSAASPQEAKPAKEQDTYEEPEIWGEWNPGQGFKVASTERGELNLSGYMVGRYLNQLPPNQIATDHLGRPLAVQARQDFQFHRVMLFSTGWFLDPKFKYYSFVWTVNDAQQVAVGGALVYDFNKRIHVGIGVNPLPITRSLQGSHPYWPTYDRVMADEFFRPFFTQGIFGGGQLAHHLHYKWMVGNNLSLLGTRATQLTRELNFGGSLTWLPTTGEFGPRGAFGDFENHEKLATRFGVGWGFSRENRQSNENDPANNTAVRLADSLNVFDIGALAPGTVVQKVTYHLLAADVGFKKRGLWVGAEGYYRLLDNFNAIGTLPVSAIRDTGFYVQAAYMVVPKKIELYTGTSYVFSNYGRPKEFIVGGNWYPANNRNYRLNVHLINVDHSPVNSTFGFYTGQLTGQVLAVGVTALY